MVDTDAWQVVLAAAASLVLSVGIEQHMSPRPQPLHQRAWPCLALHGGLWLAVFGGLVALLARPWFALVTETALLLLVVVVNNAKFASLREPFVFQDYEYFADAVRHPRLYIPFLGWRNAVAAALGFAVAISVGLWFEAVPGNRWSVSGQIGSVAALGAIAMLLIGAGSLGKLVATFDPVEDIVRMGLLASLWCYARAERVEPKIASPFSVDPVLSIEPGGLPHLVAVQSESFFDPRSIFPGIKPDVLGNFDALKTSALAHGKLTVPAWGANTVRSEFAFLSGVSADALQVHQFNPYRRVVGWGVPTLASYLKKMGYKTICVHPYPAGFYGRNRLYPLMGFDEFIDIRAFAASDRSGAYVGDIAVAKKITAILESATSPVFIHAITMENHGPLHLENINEEDVDMAYVQPAPPGCNDLTAYLKHLRNADRMVSMLTDTMRNLDRPASLCWFGDHVPIMEKVYESIGLPDGQTDFLIWQNVENTEVINQHLEAHQLAAIWLSSMALISRSCKATESLTASSLEAF